MLTTLDLPYVQAHGDGGLRNQTKLIVIHATDNTANATQEAAYCAWRPDLTSCHVFVDDERAIQVNHLDHIAYGCYPTGNNRSIQFELCGISDHLSQAAIDRAAPLVARVADAWGIPVFRPTATDLVAGSSGIVGHVDVTNAWHQSTHTDPGPLFPWNVFLAEVAKYMPPLAGVPYLRRAWPTYMKTGNYFGLISGPDASRGGYYANERPDIMAIQSRLNILGYTAGVQDGIFGPSTRVAVAAWQRAKYAPTTTLYGEVWRDDWRHLFTY